MYKTKDMEPRLGKGLEIIECKYNRNSYEILVSLSKAEEKKKHLHFPIPKVIVG